MKMFALTAAAVAGLLCTATSADAQFRYRGGSGVRVVRSYGYSSGSVVTYPSYNSSPYVSSYTGPVGVGTYTPLGGATIITPASYSQPVYNSSFYTPVYSSPVYGSSFYPPTYGSSYSYPSYSGYNSGIYISPSGGSIRSRGWRW